MIDTLRRSYIEIYSRTISILWRIYTEIFQIPGMAMMRDRSYSFRCRPACAGPSYARKKGIVRIQSTSPSIPEVR